jgi:hypothetical protein
MRTRTKALKAVVLHMPKKAKGLSVSAEHSLKPPAPSTPNPKAYTIVIAMNEQ